MFRKLLTKLIKCYHTIYAEKTKLLAELVGSTGVSARGFVKIESQSKQTEGH